MKMRTNHLPVLILLIFAFLVSFLYAENNGSSVAGDWEGVLSLENGVHLRLVVHIIQDANGQLKATMDSPDQGAKGIPISSINVNDMQLEFESAAIDGSYSGNINEEYTQIKGTWKQRGMSHSLDLTRGDAMEKPSGPASFNEKIPGQWAGTLTAGPSKLRIIFEFIKDESGNLTAKMQSPDQSENWIPVSKIELNANNIHMEVGAIGGAYDGNFRDDFSELSGVWKQAGQSFPLKLNPARGTDK